MITHAKAVNRLPPVRLAALFCASLQVQAVPRRTPPQGPADALVRPTDTSGRSLNETRPNAG